MRTMNLHDSVTCNRTSYEVREVFIFIRSSYMYEELFMQSDEKLLAEFYKEVDRIPKYEKAYNSANIIFVTVGKIESDGDWGHGGRTYIKLNCESTAAMISITDTEGKKHVFDVSKWSSFEILAGGETERQTLSEAMTDIGNFLKTGVKDL